MPVVDRPRPVDEPAVDEPRVDEPAVDTELVLPPVRHGLVDAAGDDADLDAVLAAARDGERDGAACVVVPLPARPVAADQRAATAQALAVLLATSTVPVGLGVHTATWTAQAAGRLAATAVALAGDRLVLRIAGPDAADFAAAVAERFTGPVVVLER